MKNPKQFRQGDVFIREVKKLPSGDRKPVARDNGRVVLAYGEVTGHAHTIDSPEVEMVEIAGTTYLEVKDAMASLNHQEHSTIKIPQGNYEVVHQREYSPTEIRRVQD